MDAQLQSRLHRATLVSFDVFDTAVLRALAQPTDLFRLLQPEVQLLAGATHLDFPTLRQRAEQQARDHAWQTRQATEVTLAEIYEVVRATTGIDPRSIQQIMGREIEAERTVCRVNPFIHEVYSECLAQQKRVVFISDTYLPEPIIAEILRACGYEKYEALLVSSAIGKTKATGELYAEARTRFPVPPARWLHIGDNPQSDGVNARKHRLATHHYARCVEVFTRDRRVGSAWNPGNTASPGASVALGLVANRLARTRPVRAGSFSPASFWQDFGYATAGPLFVGFTEWLIEQATRRSLRRLYFLARDGLIMKRVYESLAPLEARVPEPHYLYASRRALNVAAIDELNDHAMDFLVSGTSRLEAAQFVERLGLDWRAHADQFAACGFRGPRQKVVTGSDYDCLRRLFRALAEPIRASARRERAVLLDYFARVGLTQGGPVGVVDIGWHGTMQRSITDILRSTGLDVDMVGLYLGTHKPAAALAQQGYANVGYLFSASQPSVYAELIGTCIEIVELLFSATEGTVIRIDRGENGEFVPIRNAGDLEPYRVESIRALQRGAMEFVEEYARLKQRFRRMRLPKAVAVAQLGRVLLCPTRLEARCLGEIPHGEGMGTICTNRFIAKPPGLLRLLTRPRQFSREIKESFWRVGCAARVLPFHHSLGWVLGATPKARAAAILRDLSDESAETPERTCRGPGNIS